MLDGLILSIDAMGGDNAPDIVIKGIEYFLKHEGKNRRARFLLHGDEARLTALLKKHKHCAERSEIRHTHIEISMNEKPSQALRKGKCGMQLKQLRMAKLMWLYPLAILAP